MSRLVRTSVTCPRCEATAEFEHHASVDVTRDPQLRAAVLDRTLSVFTCRACGHEASVSHDLLYLDAARGFMVQYDPSGSFDASQVGELVAPPGRAGRARQLVTRVVSEMNDLVEKVRIFEAGLDDRVVEVIKLMLGSQHPGVAGAALYFDGLEGDVFTLVALEDGEPQGLELPRSALDDLSSRLLQSGRLGEEPAWGRVDADYAVELLQSGSEKAGSPIH
jgi:hypothetical protein